MPWRAIIAGVAVASIAATASMAADIEGVQEHPMIERYPGQDIRWQQIENHLAYRIPVGPVTGFRKIDAWIDTQGRVTRTLYVLRGTKRTYSEIYQNYLDALKGEAFEILAQGRSDNRRGNDFGSTNWTGVYLAENPPGKPGEITTMTSGTSSQGGAGAIVARKERAAGTAYVVINVEQHSADYVGTLIDIVEVAAVESGLVAVNAEAIGRDLTEKGRVVLDGIQFEFDKARLKAESKTALEAIAQYLKANPTKGFFVVGHTDGVGRFGYNQQLSADRAKAVVEALTTNYGVAAGRLEAHGVGPLVPVFSNGSDAGRDRNRRVELVERPS